MPHVHVIDGIYVDNAGQQVAGPEFDPPSWMPKTFKEAIDELAPQRTHVPPGWHRLFDETLQKLQAVSCSKRHGIEFSEVAFGRGEIVIAAQGGGQYNEHGSDPVVQGILNRLRQASTATCSCCGSRLSVTYHFDCYATLCSRCHVHQQLEQAIEDVLNDAPAYTEAQYIKWDSLPPNVQAIVPADEIKEVPLRSPGRRTKCVDPLTLRALKPKLRLLKQALETVRRR